MKDDPNDLARMYDEQVGWRDDNAAPRTNYASLNFAELTGATVALDQASRFAGTLDTMRLNLEEARALWDGSRYAETFETEIEELYWKIANLHRRLLNLFGLAERPF